MLSVHDKTFIELLIIDFLNDQFPLDYSRKQILSDIHDDVLHNLPNINWDEVKEYVKHWLEYHSQPGKELKKDKRKEGVDGQEINYYRM